MFSITVYMHRNRYSTKQFEIYGDATKFYYESVCNGLDFLNKLKNEHASHIDYEISLTNPVGVVIENFKFLSNDIMLYKSMKSL